MNYFELFERRKQLNSDYVSMEQLMARVETLSARNFVLEKALKRHTPTHYCGICSALWIQWPEGTWSLWSATCGKCCDNQIMGDQIRAVRAQAAIEVTK